MNNLSLLCAGFCIILCPLFYSACNEDQDELPPVTMEGKNTFGCLVNGKFFVSKGRIGNVGTYAEVQYAQDTIGVNLYAMNSETDQSFVFSFYDSPDLLESKRYELPEYTVFYSTKDCDYRIDNLINGWIALSKYDINAQIISGTFEFTAYSPNCGDTIRVTDGRFDIGEIIR